MPPHHISPIQRGWQSLLLAFANLPRLFLETPGLVSTAGLLALVLGLSHFHYLAWADKLLQNGILHFTPASQRAAQVVLIEVPHAQLAQQNIAWQNLLAPYLNQGVKKIGFSIALSQEQINQLAPWLQSGKIVLSQAIADDEQLSQRQHYWQQLAAGGSLNAWPDFSFPVSALPSLSFARLEQEGLASKLIQGKTILVGYAADPALRSYALPGQSVAVSQLKRDALEVDSRLQQTQLQRLSGSIFLLLGLGFFLLLAWQRSRFKLGLVLLAATWLLSIAATVVLLAMSKIWLPLAEMILLSGLLFIAVFYAKLHGDDENMRSLISSTSGKLQKLALPPSILQSQDHWPFILRLLDQTLHANRIIILEKIPGQYHLREVQALGHNADTIRELRRDYRRAPYAQAIAKRGLVEVESFLSLKEESEQQFVLPLLMQGEVLGFLAMSVLVKHCKAFFAQEAALSPIAEQIAKLLYQRQLWQAQQAQASHVWQIWLQDSNSQAFTKITRAVSLMEQRLHMVEQSFAQTSQAAIVYDLFGRVLLANTQMQQRLAKQAVRINQLSATELIAHLSGKSLEQTRLAMQELILHRQSFTWAVDLPDLADQHLVLRASVLAHDAAQAKEQPHPQPFDLDGVLVEVMDIGQLMLKHNADAEIRRQAAHYLYEDLQSLPALLRALSHDKLNANLQQRILLALGKKAASIQSIMEKSRLLLEDQADAPALCYPLDALQLLQTSLLDLSAGLEKKNVQVDMQDHKQADTQAKAVSAYGFAVPKELQFCFQAILQLLLQDASSDSQIQIRASESEQYLRLDFANQGYGIANARLQQSLDDAHSRAKTPSFAQAHAARQLVAAWGGELSFYSALGEGTRASLCLCAFWWRPKESQLLAQIANARRRPHLAAV